MFSTLCRRQRFPTSGACISLPLSSPGLIHLKIVDSIMALFRTDFSGRGELSERQQKVSVIICVRNLPQESTVLTVSELAQMLSRLTKLSEEYNVSPSCAVRVYQSLHY
jgi:hypothetical protein